jgi:geranylgeranyl reductase family protein
VAGAGPAGSIAALHLARRGFAVLLLDRAAFPREKVCGDGLITDALRALRRAGLYEEVAAAGHRVGLATAYSPAHIAVDVPGEVLTLRRLRLDAILASGAARAGARFVRGAVTSAEPREDRVRLGLEGLSGPVEARFLLIATGAGLSLQKELGMVLRPEPSAFALRGYVRSEVTLDRLLFAFDRSLAPGYGWIFPLGGGEFNVGVGRPAWAAGSIRAGFDRFLEQFPPARELMASGRLLGPPKGAMLRMGLTGSVPSNHPRVLAVGEGVGTTFPFSGEGVGKAMESAEIAAEAVGEALETGDLGAVRRYPEVLERRLRPRYHGYAMAERWVGRPWLCDLIFRRARKSAWMQEALRGLAEETVDPREVFSWRGFWKSLTG